MTKLQQNDRYLIKTLFYGADEPFKESKDEEVLLCSVLKLCDRLEEREKTILTLRFGLDGNLPKSYNEISQCIGRSKYKIRQIEKQALTKLQEMISLDYYPSTPNNNAITYEKQSFEKENSNDDEMSMLSLLESNEYSDNNIVWDVRIPDGFTEISDRMFYSCKAIQNVYLPNGLKIIGECAFAFCSNLQHIRFPSTVEIIGDSAFLCCDKLTGVVLPKTVKKIGKMAFEKCENAHFRFE